MPATWIRLIFTAVLMLPLAAAQQAASAPPVVAPKCEAEQLLCDLLPSSSKERRIHAIEQIARVEDRRYTAPLIDLLRFLKDPSEYTQSIIALNKLTGKDWSNSSDPVDDLIIWYGEHSELKPPPGYTGWKGELHAELIDPRFRDFLYYGAPATVRVEEVVWGGVKVDGIPALVNAPMIPAGSAAYLKDNDPVFGVSINGDNRAYPLRILDWHEMANDVVGGKTVALAYCTLCGSGILYDASAGGKTFLFGSSGFLFRSNKLMYDRESKTLWNQLTAQPVIGKLANSGITLKILPVVLTSWGEWRRDHPDTKVLDIKTGFNRPYELGASYGRYFGSAETMFPVWQQSKRLPKKARVFALQNEGLAKAYPLETLNRENGLVNDVLGTTPVVVIYRDAVGRVPLPADWLAAMEELKRKKASVTYANDLTLDDARAVLKKHPALAQQMTANFLLAMPTEARLPLLDERASKSPSGADVSEGTISADLRNEVAERGLIGETRAYQRGMHRFTSFAGTQVTDDKGMNWTMTEEALISSSGEKLPRMGGHLAYWFGWFSFYPKTEVYESKR
ncbi:MAG: DUF3179 domain-containing protein [Acidobacteriales bacterium]|nr:DUF3179 domain-containing protein [Terriglobales bacterium]